MLTLVSPIHCVESAGIDVSAKIDNHEGIEYNSTLRASLNLEDNKSLILLCSRPKRERWTSQIRCAGGEEIFERSVELSRLQGFRIRMERTYKRSCMKNVLSSFESFVNKQLAEGVTRRLTLHEPEATISDSSSSKS